MRKVLILVAVVAIVLAAPAAAQTVIEQHNFSTMSGWVPGPGDWVASGNRLHQRDAGSMLARIDKSLAQSGVYQIDFNIRYVDGGYKTTSDWQNQQFHAGFGVQVGVSNPPLRGVSWGLGQSYLLWLNLDTRDQTRRNAPEHYGLRAQVYESRSNTDMTLWRNETVRQLLGTPVMSLDILAILRQELGIDLRLEDIEPYLYRDVPISIRVNTRTGEIGVLDPTAPIRYFFSADPAVLRGNYIALRTNSLAVSYNNFVATSR
jgi:opacity protein-like surface antigen